MSLQLVNQLKQAIDKLHTRKHKLKLAGATSPGEVEHIDRLLKEHKQCLTKISEDEFRT